MTDEVPLTLPAMTPLPTLFSDGVDSPSNYRNDLPLVPLASKKTYAFLKNKACWLEIGHSDPTRAYFVLGKAIPVIIDSSTKAVP